MKKHDLLIADEHLDQDSVGESSLPVWTRVGVIAGGAALALARLGGVAFAAGPEAGASDQLAVAPGDGHDAAALLYTGVGADTLLNDKPAAKPSGPKTPKPKTAKATDPKTPKQATPKANSQDKPKTAKVTGSNTPRTANTPQTLRNQGLHLGQLFHGLNDTQKASVIDDLGISGIRTEDVQNMSLGELVRAAHAAGLSTRELADLLNNK